MSMSRFTELQAAATAKNLSLDVFATHAPNFYEDAVLYLAIGTGINNRHHHSVKITWDVSYSVGTREDGNSKWARALRAATEEIERTSAYTTEYIVKIDSDHISHRRARRLAKSRAYRAEKKSNHLAFVAQQAEIANSAQLTPLEAEVQGLLSTATFSGSDRDELINEKSIRLWGGKPYIFEAQFGEPAQWRIFSTSPHSNPGCLRAA
jgi:hypothetical protein